MNELLRNNPYVILEENETCESIAKNILKVSNIKNYKEYIRDIYLEKFLSKDCKEDECKEDDFKLTILKKICFHPPCFNTVINDNYCSNHLNYKFIL